MSDRNIRASMKNYLAILTGSRSRVAGCGALLTLVLCCVFPNALSQNNQAANTLSGFTLVRQVTDYDKTGKAFPCSTDTLYVSRTGDWRALRTYPNGQTIETIFLNGKGIFFTDYKNGKLVKFGDAGRPGPTTPDRLQLNPKFVRMEYLLGILAYLHRQDTNGYVEETYFAPELGPFPFKRINYFDGFKNVEEPVSLTFAEPEASDIRDAEYEVVLQKPVYDTKLADRIVNKPAPTYPAAARAAGISGEVPLMVIVDESGQVIRAAPVGALPLLNEAAIEAAYRARFAPMERDGKPVRTIGVITYQFSLR